MANADFFRKQAARCLRLSRNCYDMETARQLRHMAEEFEEKADDIAGQEDYIPGAHKNGSEGGDMDRD
jgi:hypothetical protein